MGTASEHSMQSKIPASVFVDSAKFGLATAEEGVTKLYEDTLYWHSEEAVIEALIYAFRSLAIAAGSFDAQKAKLTEAKGRAAARGRLSRRSTSSLKLILQDLCFQSLY